MVPHMVSELVRGLGSGGGQDVAATFRPSAPLSELTSRETAMVGGKFISRWT